MSEFSAREALEVALFEANTATDAPDCDNLICRLRTMCHVLGIRPPGLLRYDRLRAALREVTEIRRNTPEAVAAAGTLGGAR